MCCGVLWRLGVGVHGDVRDELVVYGVVVLCSAWRCVGVVLV